MFLLACVYIGTTSTYGDHRSCSCWRVYILGLRRLTVIIDHVLVGVCIYWDYVDLR